MAGSVNKVILVGNLGANPELKYLPSGQPVCEFRIATSESYRDRNEQLQERTEWHRIVVWGKAGENCGKFLTKGQKVYIDGRLQTRSWDDKEGKKQYITEIVANQVVFLSGPRGGAEDGARAGGAEAGYGGPPSGGGYGGGGGGGYGGGERSGGRGYGRGSGGGGGGSEPGYAPPAAPAAADMGDFGGAADDDIPF
ncbi:MAG: single-stranded DNA-binding protein [Myxococcales bacterium]|nr:single-stranded DNA-binding protein [Myxococcales bacterium]